MEVIYIKLNLPPSISTSSPKKTRIKIFLTSYAILYSIDPGKIESKEKKKYSHSEKFVPPSSIEYLRMILTYASERNQSALPINVHIYKNRDSSNYIESAFTEEKPRTAIHHCSTIVPLWKRWGRGREINWKRGVKRRAKLVTRQSTFE